MTYDELLVTARLFADAEARRLIHGEGNEQPIGLLPMSEAEKIVAKDLTRA